MSRDGYEYVLVIALTAAAIGVGGALAQMTAFWRPATPPGAAREQPSMTAGHADPGPD